MPRSISPAQSSGDDDGGNALKTAKRQRVRRHVLHRRTKSSHVKLDSDTKQKLEEQIEAAFKEAIETEAVRQRIQERLVQERARMESEVEAKIAEERRIQLLRKRKEQEQRLRDQAELERILEENQKKLEQAKAKPAEEKEEPAVAAKMQNLATARQSGDLIDDVFVLGIK
eukprot:jgi/Ulvmu1/1323/UM011_0051.1